MISERAAIHALMTLGLLQSLSYIAPVRPIRWKTIEASLGPLRLDARGRFGSAAQPAGAEKRNLCPRTARREGSDFSLFAGDVRINLRVGDHGEIVFHSRYAEPE